jgi:VanZ family protein
VDLSGGLDKLAHFGAYAVLGLCRQFAARRNRLSPLIAIGLGIVSGLSDELHQHFVPGRSVEFADWVADSLGVIAGVIMYGSFRPLVHAVTRARAVRKKGSREDAKMRRREERMIEWLRLRPQCRVAT